LTKEKELYYITIPSEVLHCKEIPANAKLLLGEIIYLCEKNKNGCCWASNNYFAELYKVSVTTVSLWISSLQEHKFIKSEINHKTNTRKIFLKTSLKKPKDNISKDILGTSIPKIDVPDNNNNFEDKEEDNNLKIETKKWTNKKGRVVGTDTIEYNE